MRGMKGTFTANFLPRVQATIHEIDFTALLHVTMSLKTKKVSVYFLEAPAVEWNIDVEVSKLEIPLHVEDMLDQRLEKEFAKINKDTPHVVSLAATVTVTQTAAHTAFGQSLQGKTKADMKNKATKDFTSTVVIGPGDDPVSPTKRKKSSSWSFDSFVGTKVSLTGGSKKPTVKKVVPQPKVAGKAAGKAKKEETGKGDDEALLGGSVEPAPKKRGFFGGFFSKKKQPVTIAEGDEEDKDERDSGDMPHRSSLGGK